MAIRKEPERRYNSVAQFADDIRRYLSGLPVIAHRDTLGYRTVKFVGRNRIAVGAATAVVLALIGGILATAHEAQIARLQRAKAEQRFADVRKLANSFLFEIHDAIERLPGSTSARQLLVTRALEYLDKLSRDAQDDASLQRELVQAYIRVGNVQGNPTNSNLGDTTGALASYKKAAQLASKLATSDPQSRRPLALVEEKIADVLAVSGDIAGALRSAKTSLAIFERIALSQPANADAEQSLAISLIKVGDVSGNPNFANAGDAAAALSRYQESLAIWQAQERVDPSNAKVRRFLGLVHERLGTILLSGNDKPSALEHLRLSSQIREGLAADFPADIEVLRDTAIAHEKIGDAFSQNGDLAAALESRSRSLAIFQRLVELDPQNVYLQLSLAISHQHMAELLAKPDAPNLERTAEGLQHCRIGIEILNSINADRANAKTRETVAELTSLAAKISP
jgi:tetratricopeptide (TPR) repeat protein